MRVGELCEADDVSEDDDAVIAHRSDDTRIVPLTDATLISPSLPAGRSLCTRPLTECNRAWGCTPAGTWISTLPDTVCTRSRPAPVAPSNTLPLTVLTSAPSIC